MISNLKALGLGLVAVLAMSAVTVSAASAAEFHAESQPVTLTGTQGVENIFSTEGGEAECASATFEGTISAVTTASITLHPTYSGCEFLGLLTDIISTGCNLTVTTNGVPHYTCGPGGKTIITPTVSGKSVCSVAMSPQTPTSGSFSFSNSGTGTTRQVTATANVSGIHYEVIGGKGNCGSEGGHIDGTYTGSILITGENPTTKAHIGVWFQ